MRWRFAADRRDQMIPAGSGSQTRFEASYINRGECL